MPSAAASRLGEDSPPLRNPRSHRRAAGGSGWRSSSARLGLLFGALLSVSLLAVAGYAWYTYRDIDTGVTRVDAGALNRAPAVPVRPSGATASNAKDMNILLIGSDDRQRMTNAEVRDLHVGRDGGGINTDTMMVLHVPADGHKATLISLPRDSYVHIKGFGSNRLNSAYGDGYRSVTGSTGAKRSAAEDLLISTISDLTGLTINHYVQISFLGFYEISKALHGIPINLCESTDDTAAATIAAGLRHFLDPWGGDLARVRRQQYFLTAAFRKVASLGILTELHGLGDAVKRNVIMDPNLDLLELAHQLQALSADHIAGATIPTTPERIDGMDVLRVSPTRVRTFVAGVLNPARERASPQPSTTRSSASRSHSQPPTGLDRNCIH
jgi:LCP family protein required for cell wall assembly